MGLYTEMNTALFDRWLLAFDIFVMTLIEIGPLFALFLNVRESHQCYSVYLPRFFSFCFFFFASQEHSHSHYFKPVYKPTHV